MTRRSYACPSCREELVYDPDDDRLVVKPWEPECRCGHPGSDHIPPWGCAAYPCDCEGFRSQHRSIKAEGQQRRRAREAG